MKQFLLFLLNKQVYGETSFELVEELTKVTKFGEDDVFIDLGSGKHLLNHQHHQCFITFISTADDYLN